MQRYWAVVPAAGGGTRMGAPLPKQYLPLAGRSLLECSVAPLLACGWIDGVVLALARNDSHFATLPMAGHPKLFTTFGGAERADSVAAGLAVVAQRCLSQSSTRVLVHDAARPGLNQRLLDALREGDDLHHGALLALPSTDTLKRADGKRSVATIDRSCVWRAQTPQLFGLQQLQQALAQAKAENFVITDEASAVERLGATPRLVVGAERNLKVTYPEDLALAGYWLAQTG